MVVRFSTKLRESASSQGYYPRIQSCDGAHLKSLVALPSAYRAAVLLDEYLGRIYISQPTCQPLLSDPVYLNQLLQIMDILTRYGSS